MRAMSGRSWSMAASMLAVSVAVSLRAACLLCSTRSSASRWMVRMVETPKPTMRTTTMRTVILTASGARTSDSPRPARPVRLAQHPLDELARGVAREIVVKGHLAGHLVAGEMLAREGDHVIGGQSASRARLDGRVHTLAPIVVGHSKHRHVLNIGMAVQRVLDLRGIDVDARRDDHVALAITDVVEALGVPVRHVAHGVPVAPPHRRAGRGVLVVLIEDAGELLDVELARLPHGHGLAVVVEERELTPRRRLAT